MGENIDEMTALQQMEEASQVDTTGYSKKTVLMLNEPLLGKYKKLPRNTNGSGSNGWKCLDKGSAAAAKYRILKIYKSGKGKPHTVKLYEGDSVRETNGQAVTDVPSFDNINSGSLVAWMFYGFVDSNIAQKNKIPSSVRRYYAESKCAFSLAKNNIEIDHKFGRFDQDFVSSPNDESPDNFQPITRERNLFKRSQCQICAKTNNRFDAKELGYTIGWTIGGMTFKHREEGCRGCYLFDPMAFNGSLYKGK